MIVSASLEEMGFPRLFHLFHDGYVRNAAGFKALEPVVGAGLGRNEFIKGGIALFEVMLGKIGIRSFRKFLPKRKQQAHSVGGIDRAHLFGIDDLIADIQFIDIGI